MKTIHYSRTGYKSQWRTDKPEIGQKVIAVRYLSGFLQESLLTYLKPYHDKRRVGSYFEVNNCFKDGQMEADFGYVECNDVVAWVPLPKKVDDEIVNKWLEKCKRELAKDYNK